MRGGHHLSHPIIVRGGISRTHDSLTWSALSRSSRDIAPLPDEDPVGIVSGSELGSLGAVPVWGQPGAVSSRSREITALDHSALAHQDHSKPYGDTEHRSPAGAYSWQRWGLQACARELADTTKERHAADRDIDPG